MTKKLVLTNEDYCRAAKRLRCDVAAIKAVARVESRGNGFLRSGKPKILFERHKFYKYTKGKYRRSHPHLCNRRAGGYGRGGENQWRKFSEAFKLDPVAAMLSVSWGQFQIMGFNYAICGYTNIHDFVDAMKSGVDAQLDAFVEFVIHSRLDDEIRRLDWARFARGYNGKGYRRNRYDVKMAKYYLAYKRERINCSKLMQKVKDVVDMTKPTEYEDVADANELLKDRNDPDRPVLPDEIEHATDEQIIEMSQTDASGIPESENVSRETSPTDPPDNQKSFTEKTSETLQNVSEIGGKASDALGQGQEILGRVSEVKNQVEAVAGGGVGEVGSAIIKSRFSWSSIFKIFWTNVIAISFGVMGFVLKYWYLFLIAFGVLALAGWLYNESKRRKDARERLKYSIASDPNKINVLKISDREFQTAVETEVKARLMKIDEPNDKPKRSFLSLF